MDVKTKKIAIVAAIAGVVAIGAFVVMRDDPLPVCDRSALSLPDDAPLELAAILNRDCAVAFIRQSDDPREAALTMGYPSILKDYVRKSEMHELLDLLVSYGERDGIRRDDGFLTYLDDIGEDGRVKDFAVSTLAPERLSEGGDLTARLDYLPIWKDPQNVSRLISACEGLACDTKTNCESQVGLQDKLAVAKGEITLDSLVARCEPAPEWVMALRRSGVVDTSCSGTLQMNAPQSLTAGCFAAGIQVDAYSSFTPGDSIAFLRNWNMQGRTARIHPASLDSIAFQFPSTAEFLRTAQ